LTLVAIYLPVISVPSQSVFRHLSTPDYFVPSVIGLISTYLDQLHGFLQLQDWSPRQHAPTHLKIRVVSRNGNCIWTLEKEPTMGPSPCTFRKIQNSTCCHFCPH